MRSRIVYFEERGRNNTRDTLEIARQRALDLGVDSVVVASSHGGTVLQAAQVFAGSGIQVISVSISHTFEDLGWCMTPEEKSQIEQAGIKVITGVHGLGDGLAEGFYGEHTPGSIVADTLRLFSQGTKVAVEVSIMALEAGLIKPGSEVIALGGSSEGCDTALVVRPSYARKIKDFKICEILCKPRIG